MILHSIELCNVGRFLGDVRLGPFDRRLNIVAAPNESGKTTALRAAARALFDRHTTKDGEMKSLQPAGTDLCPRIAVEFETCSGRYRIEKNFLQTPSSILRQWRETAWAPIAEGDAADRRVQELLNSSLPGRGATKPEHWGFLGFLWARQGEASVWPTLDGDAVGTKIRARLVRVELDPVIERLRANLSDKAQDVLTSTGRPRVNGPLERAEEELALIDASLAAIRQTRLEMEAAHQRYDQASVAVSRLEQEQVEREHSARALAEQASAAERLRGELDARQTEFAAAQARLEHVLKDSDALQARENELAAARAALTAGVAKSATAEKELAAIRTAIDDRQANRTAHERRLADLREAHQQARSRIRHRESTVQAAALARQLALAEETARDLGTLQARLSHVPGVTAKQVQRFQDLSDSVQSLRAQVQALGLTVELTPGGDSTIVVNAGGDPRSESLRAGETHRIQSPEALTLDLADWGRVVIRSGAGEVRDVAGRLVREEAQLRTELQMAEVPTLDAAREAVAIRGALEAEIKASTTNHERQLGEHATIDRLREAAAAAHRRAEALAATLPPLNERREAPSLTDLEAEDVRLAGAIAAAERELRVVDEELGKLRARERNAGEAVQECATAASQHRAMVLTAESQIAALRERYPGGIEAAKTQAASESVKAEVRRDETRRQLPPDFEALPERNRRAAAALQQITSELAARRAERDAARGALETLGGQGLYSRETALEEQRAEVLLRRDAARRRGWAARIASDLIEFRKQAATRAVLSPLEDRLSAAFARLTGNSDRRVFLDDHLQIAGLGRSRDAIYPFEGLSQGAREQLLLCFRIAVAQELAAEEPQTLILDDVLVNTDAVRQERILDLLGTLSAELQILILTCHPDRYRGAGRSIAFG